MIWLISIVSIIMPLAMYGLRLRWPQLAAWYDLGALVSATAFFIRSSAAVAEVLLEHTVMMTEIHKVFLSPVFLISAGYIGIYLLYLAWCNWLQRRNVS